MALPNPPSWSEDETSRIRSVVIGGSGEWADALAAVIRDRCGLVARASTPKLVLFAARLETRPVVVAGPPFNGAELIELCAPISRDGTLIAALDANMPSLRADLLTLGAVRTLALPKESRELVDEVLGQSGAGRRYARRARFVAEATVRFKLGHTAAGAFDISESGIGLRMTSPPVGVDRIRFEIPGTGEAQGGTIMRPRAELAWSAADSERTFRAGFRFLDLSEHERTQIREYVRLAE